MTYDGLFLSCIFYRSIDLIFRLEVSVPEALSSLISPLSIHYCMDSLYGQLLGRYQTWTANENIHRFLADSVQKEVVDIIMPQFVFFFVAMINVYCLSF